MTIGKVNWHRVKAEYVKGVSQRKLAAKYHVSRDSIARHCRLEKWTEERKAAKTEITQSVIQKTAEAVADNAALAERIKRKGLETLDRLFDEFASINSTEHRDIGKNTMDIKRLRDLTAAYKDLTDDLPKAEDKGTMEKLDAMLAEVKSYASNA